MPAWGLHESFEERRPITAWPDPTPFSGTKPTNLCANHGNAGAEPLEGVSRVAESTSRAKAEPPEAKPKRGKARDYQPSSRDRSSRSCARRYTVSLR